MGQMKADILVVNVSREKVISSSVLLFLIYNVNLCCHRHGNRLAGIHAGSGGSGQWNVGLLQT